MDSKWVDAKWALPELGHEVELFDTDEKLRVATYCAPDAYTDKTPYFYCEAGILGAGEVVCWRYAPSLGEIQISQEVTMTRRSTTWH